MEKLVLLVQKKKRLCRCHDCGGNAAASHHTALDFALQLFFSAEKALPIQG